MVQDRFFIWLYSEQPQTQHNSNAKLSEHAHTSARTFGARYLLF